MKLTIKDLEEDDLKRAEELTVRTHQLNTTGYTYNYDELNEFRHSNNHKLLIAGLEDRYGTYGKIGLVLIECNDDIWTIKLLLMSCRVMSRGVGTVIINHIIKLAKENNVKLQQICFQRSNQTGITYKFAGFTEVDEQNEVTILENDYSNIQSFRLYDS